MLKFAEEAVGKARANGDMKKQYHILNGDGLNAQLRETALAGERIIMREAMVAGPLTGSTLSELYQTRAGYLFST